MKSIKEIAYYIFFGALTTLVNIVTYWLLSNVFGIQYLVSNAVAWVASVLFAYITNRKYVFESSANGVKAITIELSSFVGFRLFSGLVDMGCMYFFIDILSMNDMIVKIGTNVIVVVINYLFSKLFIFKSWES